MERLKLKYQDACKALVTFKSIMVENYSIIVRDAAIQRFEYTFEALWKFLKEYLKEKEGLVVTTPKSVFRSLFSLKFLSEEETVLFLEMTDQRNETVHTYKEEVANSIYQKARDYPALIEQLMQRFEGKI